jgi:sugar lactone lactonase YvrE
MATEVAFDVGAGLGEGALWDWRQGRLVSVDILAGRLLVSDPEDGSTRSLDVGQPVSAAMLRGQHELVLAVRDGFTSIHLDNERLGDLVPVEGDLPTNRMNDGACDARGRCFAGTMAFDSTPGAGTLYRLDPDLSVHPILNGLGISNGIGWNAAGDVMYHVDSLASGIDAYDYDEESGLPSGKRRLADTEPAWGLPDGLAIDAEGGIWVAFWDGSAVRRFDAAGSLTATIELPAARPTRPAFGGPDLDRLYVTTARREPSGPAGDDLGGAVLVVEPGVRGTAENVFTPSG